MKKFIKKGALTAAILLTGVVSAVFAAVPALSSDKTVRNGAQENAAFVGLNDIDGAAGFFADAEEAAVLRQGSTGGEVKEVQRRLKQWGYYNGQADGIFGAGTKAAVIAFQKKNGLTADGVVGLATYRALGMNSSYNVLANQNSKPSGYTSSELYLLAKTIYAEGRGEPYTGQVAIGAVILNRVRSSAFPNTVSGVVYQKHAFTAVSDGQINLTPDNTAMRAAQDAVNGWDPTGGALYYYNPAVATSSWIFGRQTITVIGKHVFAI